MAVFQVHWSRGLKHTCKSARFLVDGRSLTAVAPLPGSHTHVVASIAPSEHVCCRFVVSRNGAAAFTALRLPFARWAGAHDVAVASSCPTSPFVSIATTTCFFI